MMNLEFLEKIEEDCKKFEIHNDYKKLQDMSEMLATKYNLFHIGTGVSRYVYKAKYAREVVKLDISKHYNIAEYCIYHGLKDYNIGKILAKCNTITKSGMVMAQENIPYRLKEYSFDPDGAWDYSSLRNQLEDCFHFIAKWKSGDLDPIYDFHEDNIRVANDMSAKIIDYAPLLCPYSATRKFTVDACIKSIRRFAKKHDQSIELFMDSEKNLTLKTKNGVRSTGLLTMGD